MGIFDKTTSANYNPAQALGFPDAESEGNIAHNTGVPTEAPGEKDSKVAIDEATGDLYTWDGAAWNIVAGGGGGAVSSVNAQTGAVVLDTDDISEGSSNFYLSVAEASKLAGIEAGAEVNQTDSEVVAQIDADLGNTDWQTPGTLSDAEIKTGYENNADTNAFTDAEQTKLAGVEASATADQTGTEIVSAIDTELGSGAWQVDTQLSDAEVKTAYENNADTNAFTDAEQTKLAGVEASATADQTGAEIKVAYEAEADTNAFTDAEKTLLGNQSGTNTGDMSDADVKTAYENNADTNAFTDAEKTLVGNTSGVNTGDQGKPDFDLDHLFTLVGASADTDENLGTFAGSTITDNLTIKAALQEIETAHETIGNALNFQGDWDASVGTFPGAGLAQTGDLYVVTVAGTVSTETFAVGDQLYARTDNASATVYAANWIKVDAVSEVTSVAGKIGSVTLDTDDVTAVTDKNYVTDAEAVVIGNTSGTNSGDQTSIVGITGTKAEFDTAVTDGNILYDGDITQYTDADVRATVLTGLSLATGGPIAATDSVLGGMGKLQKDITDLAAGSGIPASTFDAKGDILVATADDTTGVLSAGADGTLLVAKASEATGYETRTLTTGDVSEVTDKNYITDAEQTKLTGIESGATADQTGAEIKTAYEAEANAFTDAQFTKLAGIEAGATADQTSIVGITGTKAEFDTAVTDGDILYVGDVTQYTDADAIGAPLTAYSAGAGTVTATDSILEGMQKLDGNIQAIVQEGTDLGYTASPTNGIVTNDTGTDATLTLADATNAGLMTPADFTKLGGIEAAADVTDTANVTSAGALMDSEVTDLAGIKAVTVSTLQVKPAEGAFVDGDKTKLDGIETGATADQTSIVGITGTVAEFNTAITDATLSGNNTGDEVAADTTTAGVIEIATLAEVTTGTATDLAVTPQGVKQETDLKADKTVAQNAQTGTAYGPVASDANKVVTLDNASAVTVTLSSATHAAGDVIAFIQKGAGTVTFAGSGVTINSQGGLLDTNGQYAQAAVWFESPTVAYLSGNLSA